MDVDSPAYETTGAPLHPDARSQARVDARLADGAILLTFIACFWSSIVALNEKWAAFNASYSHGYLVLAMMLYFIWLLRDRLLHAPAEPQLAVALPLSALAGLWGVATIAGVETIGILVLPAMLIGLVLLTRGWATARALALPIALLYSAIPFWEDIFALPLRNLTASVSEWYLLTVNPFPVHVEQYAFHLSSGTFFIADECNGMSFFVSSITIGLAYGHLNIVGTAKRLAFLLFCMAMSLLSNWVRVVSIIYIGHYSAMQSPMVTPEGHLAYGWVLFALAMGVMLYVGYLLSSPPDAPAAPRAEPGHREGMRPSTLAAALLPMLLAPVIAYGHLALSTTRASPTLGSEFQALDASAIDWVGQFSGTPERIIGGWTGGAPITAMLVHYGMQSQGNELVAFGNSLAVEDAWTELSATPVTPGDNPALPFVVMQTELAHTSGRRRLVWHVNLMGGYPAIGRSASKLQQVRAALIDNRSDATLVAISLPCANDCRGARAALDSAGPGLIRQLASRLE